MGDSFHLPYQRIPGGPIEGDLTRMLTAGSVVVRAGFVEVPPEVCPSGRAPTLAFDFGLAEGGKMPTVVLVLDVERMLALSELVRKAIRDAVRVSRNAS